MHTQFKARQTHFLKQTCLTLNKRGSAYFKINLYTAYYTTNLNYVFDQNYTANRFAHFIHFLT